MNGNEIIIQKYVVSNWTAIASVKSHEVQTNADSKPVASATQQEWEEVLSGRKSWSLNVNYLVTSVNDIEDVLAVGTVVKLRICDRPNNGAVTKSLEGFAEVVQCKQTYTRGNLVAGSFAFRGHGPLAPPTPSTT